MKRLFTLVVGLLGLALSGVAQAPVQFYYKGQPLDDGATVTIEAETDDWGDLVCESNPSADPQNGLVLKNLTAADLSGMATLTISANTLAPTKVQWCMGGLCVVVPTDTFDKDFTVPASGQILTQFDAFPTQYGELRAEIKVVANLRPLTVNVVFVHRDPAAPLTFLRRSVIEEYTGTWCGNCPRGIVGLQRLSEEFGDRCIAIAVHSGAGEPMQILSYPDLQPGTGIPACNIDRGPKLDPYRGSHTAYHYNINADFAARLAEPSEAGLELSAQWADANQWDVRFTATTTFGFSGDAANYRLAFILLEDGMKGTGKDWVQVNYFSTSSTFDDSKTYLDDDMAWWRNAPLNVTDIEYNHVPVNTLGIKTGIQGSIQSPAVKGEAQTYAADVTTLGVKIIQDKARLSAVALLLNTETGRVVNAARADIRPFGTAAVQSVAAPQQSAAPVYDLQGRRIATPQKGLYIQNGKKYVKP